MAAARAMSSFKKDGTVATQAIDDEQWRTEVEEPTKKLALFTLPTLSDGWGKGVGLVSVGWVCGGLGWFLLLHEIYHYVWAAWAVVCCFVALPAALVIDPASASSGCARLEDRITDLCIEDPGHPRRLGFVKSLKGANKDQGL